MPKIKSANEVLEAERKKGRLDEWNMETVDEGAHEGGYIEMNLGLGVLEEKTGNDAHDRHDDDGESEGEKEGREGVRRDVLEELKGKKGRPGKGKGKMIIEVRS